jgi:hypothetical protein
MHKWLFFTISERVLPVEVKRKSRYLGPLGWDYRTSGEMIIP